MNISSLKVNRNSSAGALNAALNGEVATTTPVGTASALMSCEACGLSGGPFAPAEAAHLRAIHDRMFHGYSSAA